MHCPSLRIDGRSPTRCIPVIAPSAVVGVWGGAVAMAIKPITIGKGVPLFVTGSGDEVTWGDNKGLVWRFQTRGTDWGAVFARAALNDGARTRPRKAKEGAPG